MTNLVDANGRPIMGDTKRREMKSGQIKKTVYGDVIIKLVVDLPKAVPEDDFKKIMEEYGHILAEAFKK